ncbi:MAG: pilus assembly protein PilM [Bdellovibrionales bacterium]|nr:pilus assembly protein PilM [Bdellovibrionales bacterium]
MRSVGIDIGRFSVKIAEVEATQRSFTLTRLEEFPLSTDPTKDTEIEVLDILRTISSQYSDHSSTLFVFGLPQEQVIVRLREFPFKERHKILKSIPFELEDDIPFSSDGAIFDGKVTRYRGAGAEVLACTTPLARIKAQIQKARDGSIDPSIICPEGIAFANLFEDWSEPPIQEPAPLATEADVSPSAPHGAQAILNIGHKSTFLIIRSENRLVAIRTLDWGGTDIANALAKKYQIHIVEALKELRKKGFILTSDDGATNDQISFSNTIKEVVDGLAHELHLTLLEIESDQNIHIEKAFLCGGACQLQNLGPYLTQKLEIPFNRLKEISGNASLNFESNNAGEVSGAVAISLAIEGLKRPRNPAVNLLRGVLAKQSQTFKRVLEKWGHTLTIAAVSFAALLIWSILRESFSQTMTESALEQLKVQAQNITGGELKGARANSSNIRKYIQEKENEAKNRKLAEKVHSISSALDVLKSITESTPSKKKIVVDVASVRVDNDQVEIQGSVASPSQIDALVASWKGLSLDGKIEKFNPTVKIQSGKSAFGLRFRVERIKGS